MNDIMYVLATLAGGVIAIGYFFAAGAIIATVHKDAEMSRQWLVGLFIANFVLAGLLIGKIL